MKRRLLLAPSIRGLLRKTTPGPRRMIADTLLDLVAEPEPLIARPYGGIPAAFEIRAETFRLAYTYGPDHVSVWVLEINT